MDNLVIGITGTNGSGKGSAVRYLQNKYGAKSASLSATLKKILKEQNIEVTRDNLIDLGNKLRKENGSKYIAKLTLDDLKSDSFDGIIVIDSLRNVREIEYFKKYLNNFAVIGIDADPKIRYKRSLTRNQYNEHTLTMKEFLRIEDKENNNQNHASQLPKCLSLADHKVINNGTLEKFHSQIDKIIEAFL